MTDILGLPLAEALEKANADGYLVTNTILVSCRKGSPGEDSRVIAVRPGIDNEITILYSNFKTVI